MQSNSLNSNVLRKITNKVRSSGSILLTSHINADPDGLGSCIAVYRWLKKQKKKVHIVCSKGVSTDYSFLSDTGTVGSGPDDLWREYDLVITFDCSDFDRLDTISKENQVRNAFIINIDHHKTNTRFGDINWIDHRYASTTLMVYDLLVYARARIDKKTAMALYTGLVTDTGHFAFSNTDRRCHRVAEDLIAKGVVPEFVSEQLYRRKKKKELDFTAYTINNYETAARDSIFWVVFDQSLFKRMKYVPGDTQEYINILKSIEGCRLAILFREVRKNVFKVSLRSSKGIDSTKIASNWGGGGHERASGFMITGVRKKVIRDVINYSRKFVRNGK